MEQHLQIFRRWRCITHDCGSYNFNALLRHEMNTCEIITDETVGVCKPKTFGTATGELSRQFFDDWNKEVRMKELQRSAIKKWIAYRARQVKQYYKNKYADRSKGIQRYKGKSS